jgi:hypothetical protein
MENKSYRIDESKLGRSLSKNNTINDHSELEKVNSDAVRREATLEYSESSYHK